jgi:adenylosuccinate synthase
LSEKLDNDIKRRIKLHRNSQIITPFHVYVGRAREAIRREKFSSTGNGVGECVRDYQSNGGLSINQITYNLKSRLLKIRERVLSTLKVWLKNVEYRQVLVDGGFEKEYERMLSDEFMLNLLDEYRRFDILFRPMYHDYNFLSKLDFIKNKTIIFEGTQGMLLDADYGFIPYVSKTHISTINDPVICGSPKKVIGVSRVFMTRHGNGPLVTEDPALLNVVKEKHNVDNEWQGSFRVGWPDLVALRYAIDMNGFGKIHGIALTHVDLLSKLNGIKVCVGYDLSDSIPVWDDNYGEYFNFPERMQTGATSCITNKIKFIDDNTDTFVEFVPRRTDMLLKAKPVYQVFKGSGWERRFTEFIEKELNIPIVIISTGPTYKDTRVMENTWFDTY